VQVATVHRFGWIDVMAEQCAGLQTGYNVRLLLIVRQAQRITQRARGVSLVTAITDRLLEHSQAFPRSIA
jgi:hypothetical protein